MFDINDMEKNVIYIDSRESERIKRFQNFLISKIAKDKKSKPILENGLYKLRVTGSNKYLLFSKSEVVALPIGDFMLNGIFFEFKRDEDLIDSIRNDRLDKQIDNYRVNFYDYEFHVIAPNKHKIHFDETNYFSDQTDVLFDQFENETECFKYILNVWANHQKSSRNHTLNKRYKGNGYEQIGAMLVGHNLLTKISHEFPGTKATDWLDFNEDKLKEVSGIGNAKAKQILRKIKAYV